jgi:uncharacterized membrane protein (UPF0127 family)
MLPLVRIRPFAAVALAIAVVGIVAAGFLLSPLRLKAQASPGCDASQPPYGVVQIDTFPRVDLELAQTPEQREFGLMNREWMPPDNGMLFVYQNESHEAYWMYHTLLPLSIAFVDRDGTIVDIKDMPRLSNPDDAAEAARFVYPSVAPYWYALEVNQGWFFEHGVGVGQRFMFCLGA